MKTKKCSKCSKGKELKEFGKNSASPDGLKAKCKECRKEDYENNKEEILIKCKEYYLENSEEKKAYQRQYRLDNLEQIKLDKKQYTIDNKELIAKYQKEYRNKPGNKEKSRICHKVNIRKRRKNDINLRITDSLRTRINTTLHGINKSLSTMFLIGCEIDYLMYYIQEQFTKGMSWDNHGIGGWEIDHIKPCAKFDLSKKSQQLRCFNYTNLQPLWAEENLRKSDNYE